MAAVRERSAGAHATLATVGSNAGVHRPTMSATSSFLRTGAWWMTLCLAVHSGAAFAESGQTTCEALGVRVLASLAQDAADACRGAKDAIDFFRGRRLKTDISIEIHVQDDMPPAAGPGAAGSFLEREGRILILPYAAFRRNETWFGVPIDRHLYRSVAAHEVAHALAAANFSIPNPSIQAKEYIAYVAMFSSMDPALRARILDAVPQLVSGRAVRLTAPLHMFEPMRFGVESYRHFLDLESGHVYLQEVFAGKALAH